MERTKPVHGSLSVLLAAVNLAISPLVDRLSICPLASDSEAAFWQFALVIVLGQLALISLCIAWVVFVGLALCRRERYPWLLALALVVNVGAVYWWIGNAFWRIAGDDA